MGDYDQAISALDQAVRLDPNDAIALRDRGFCYHRKGDFEQAIQDYDQALRLDPTDVNTSQNRALAQRQQK